MHRVDISILNHEQLTGLLMISGGAGLVLGVLWFWLLRKRPRPGVEENRQGAVA